MKKTLRVFKNLFFIMMLSTLSLLISSKSKAIAESVRIVKIDVEGLERTKRLVVDRELLFREGDLVKRDDLEESIQRLHNIQLFSKVDYTLTAIESGYILKIDLKERWTTIPIAKFSSGGGLNQSTIGAYDVNLFGRYIEAGGQYERLGDENAGVVWLRNPRLFNQRLELFTSLWDIRRSETIYEDLGRSDMIEGGLMTHRRKAAVSLKKEWLWWLETGIFTEYHLDSCSPNLLYTDTPDQRSQIILDHEENTSALLVGGTLKLGRLNYRSFLVEGLQFDHTLTQTSSLLGTVPQFTSNESQLLAFATLPYSSTLGIRMAAGFSDTSVSQYYYFLGGLDRIRGYQASRFYGKNYWLLNAELRVPVYKSPNIVVQPTVFVDSAGFAIERRELSRNNASSAGFGLRIMAPQIYRLVLRIDYARAFLDGDSQPISFGVQQFF